METRLYQDNVRKKKQLHDLEIENVALLFGHCKSKYSIYLRQLWTLHFLIFLSRSEAVDSLLVNYAQTSSNFTLICWSVSSVSAVFLIANKLCKNDWLTSGPMCSSSCSGEWPFNALEPFCFRTPTKCLTVRIAPSCGMKRQQCVGLSPQQCDPVNF